MSREASPVRTVIDHRFRLPDSQNGMILIKIEEFDIYCMDGCVNSVLMNNKALAINGKWCFKYVDDVARLYALLEATPHISLDAIEFPFSMVFYFDNLPWALTLQTFKHQIPSLLINVPHYRTKQHRSFVVLKRLNKHIMSVFSCICDFRPANPIECKMWRMIRRGNKSQP